MAVNMTLFFVKSQINHQDYKKGEISQGGETFRKEKHLPTKFLLISYGQNKRILVIH